MTTNQSILKFGIKMINKEEFANLLREHEMQNARVDLFTEIFPMAYDSPLIEFGWRMFDKLLNTYFTEEGVDWIQYYLYENPEKCYYESNIKIPLETIDDIWKVIESYRK